jgi:hypothetical protein
MKEGQFEKAINKFNFILKVNPGDNQGVRFLIPECLMSLKKYHEFLELDSASEDTDSIEYCYARVFSRYKLQELDKTKTELNYSRQKHPYVAEEIAKDSHSFPSEEFAHLAVPLYGIPTGSRQEAFTYWARTKNVWEAEKGFKEFVRNN